MLKKLCLFQIIILTLRHNSKVKPRLSGTQNHQRFYLQHKMISIMARVVKNVTSDDKGDVEDPDNNPGGGGSDNTQGGGNTEGGGTTGGNEGDGLE